MADATLQVGEAYVSGALTSLEDGARTRLFYELLAEVVEASGLRAYLPHRVTDPATTAHLDPRAVYDIDRAHVTGSRVVVAYAGIPSFGVGIEVELAREHGIPVILVVERDRTVSRLLLGNPAVVVHWLLNQPRPRPRKTRGISGRRGSAAGKHQRSRTTSTKSRSS